MVRTGVGWSGVGTLAVALPGDAPLTQLGWWGSHLLLGRSSVGTLALSLGEGERLHHRVFSTRKVKISSPHQWDILANLITPVHSAKHIDIQCIGINIYLHVSDT
jgi:hypothetical protein